MIELKNATTYQSALPFGDKVEIGDLSSIDFKPHLKLNRWGEECFIKVGLAGEVGASHILDGNKVKRSSPKVDAHFYPLEPTTVIAKDKDGNDVEFKQNELGGFEFEVILKEKPTTNKIVLNIETQGLKFYYQPELTPEEIAEGSFRPDNVIGSYAVYHATRTNMHRSKADAEKYKAGKAFHIYRPKITDAEGKWVWGELSLDEVAGTLTTTIPQEFLDSAVYPVSTGTTNFGYEIMGSTLVTLENRIYAISATGGVGTGISISAFINCTTEAKNMLGILYEGALNAATKVENGITEEILIPNTQDGLQTWNFLSAPTLAVKTYYIGVSSASGAGFGRVYADTGANRNGATITYPSFPDPCAFTAYDDFILGIYCTYEAGGGTTVTPGVIALNDTEYIPVLKHNIITGTLAQTLTPSNAVTGYGFIPTTLSLTDSEFAPVLKEELTPTTLTLSATKYAPVLKLNIITGLLTLTLSEYSPVLKFTVTPSTLALLGTTYASVLKLKVIPSTLTFNLTKYIPSIIEGEIVTPEILALILSLLIPSIVTADSIIAETGRYGEQPAMESGEAMGKTTRYGTKPDTTWADGIGTGGRYG